MHTPFGPRGGGPPRQAPTGAASGKAARVALLAQLSPHCLQVDRLLTEVNAAHRALNLAIRAFRDAAAQDAAAAAAMKVAKSSYDTAKDQIKLAMRLLQENVERQSQVVNKIASC